MLNVTGMFSLWYGVLCMYKYFFGEDRGRILPELVTGIVLIVLGVILVRVQTAEQYWHVPVIAFLFLMMSLQVFLYAMELMFANNWWRVAVMVVVVSVLVAFNMLAGRSIFDFPRYIIPGFQILVLGGLMIWLSVLDKNLATEYRKTLRELKEGYQKPG